MRRNLAPELPAPLELDCLKTLWMLGPSSIRSVREAMVERRPLAYTTVGTILDRLVRKGFASRHRAEKAFVYVALVDPDTLRRAAVRQLVSTLFEGSEEALVSYLRRSPAGLSAAGPAATDLDAALL